MSTIDPMLSILIPSVPSRVMTHLLPLFEKLEGQIAACGAEFMVEILCVLDNKTRSIGLKREDLVQRARGRWLAFVDDDDDVAPEYLTRILGAATMIYQLDHHAVGSQVDVIVFDQITTIDGGPPLLIRHGLEYENTEVGPEGATRKPWHHNVWRSVLAKTAHFPDCSYGEDAHWLAQLWPKAHGQHRIEGPPLHIYRFNTATTEAELTFPPKESDGPAPAVP